MVPQLSREQRLDALERAKEARRRRREVRDAVAAGKLKVSEVLDMDEPTLRRMRVLDLVCAVRGYGPTRAGQALDELGISHKRRLGGLGRNQKAALCERFG